MARSRFPVHTLANGGVIVSTHAEPCTTRVAGHHRLYRDTGVKVYRSEVVHFVEELSVRLELFPSQLEGYCV